ncbi:hypothetical protein BDZ97DRAFT_60426 [Flammula alnicola]|nr:hypothetical protein BDZ97DRAFT_60426 [Flammula alnicola]
MPRRSNTRASNLHTAPATSPQPPQHDPESDNLALLRRQWRWAAFSQFFCTFSQLFAMNDVTVADIERDLVHQTNQVIPRIMQKLLYSLSYDRKVSVDNWQTALRKQYMKRDPHANPIGPEPKDPRHFTKDEEEEPETLELETADSSPEHNNELKTERANDSLEASVSVEPVPEDLAVPKNDTLSRQSSVAGNHAGLDSKYPRADSETEQESSIDWFDLPILSKLESMHTLTEWQFQNPTRLRTLMKSDDELASWRIEPIGYDSKWNAYWFIGGERLWIQRAPPKVAKAKVLKRKRAPEKASQKSQPNSKNPSTPIKRARLNVASVDPSPPASGRHSRAAKDQAKLKLDVQARELAELNRQAAILNRKPRAMRQTSSRTQPSRSVAQAATSRPVGTRASARLRGVQEEEEWQPIPDEWLNEGERGRNIKSTIPKTGLESDEETISDLTELSEEVGEGSSTSQHAKAPNHGKGANGVDFQASDEQQPDKSQDVPDDFVEWETICATLYEWEHIAERFEKATHYSEKALHKKLVNDIVPFITQELREIERKREIEEALVHRKRSSRIAIRESEREEARLAAKRKQEEDEKLSRARRMEARQQKEEAERIKREKAREQRKQEREAREESRKAQTSASQQEQADAEDVLPKAKAKTPSAHEKRGPKVNGSNKTHSGSRTPAGEDWELACEICQRHGINLDDGTPMMSCGRCSKWQHILCHDRADKAAGRPPRNWDTVEFICRSCRASQQARYREYYPPVTQHSPHQNVPQMQPYRSYQPAVHPSAVELRPSHYMPNHRDPVQQSFYMRPTNGQQLNPQGMYQPSSSSHVPSTAPPRSTISFNHYQPAAHGFSSSNQKVHADSYYPYHHSNQHQPYNNSTQQYGHPSQQFRSAVPPPYNKSQAPIPSWNIATPPHAHAPGYSVAHNAATGAPSTSAYRTPPFENQDIIPLSEPSQPSFPRYPAEQHYPPTQFKHHPSSYQPPLGGQ